VTDSYHKIRRPHKFSYPSFPFWEAAAERTTRTTVFNYGNQTAINIVEDNAVEPLNEPKGWRHLQEMAQREQDPGALAAIIDKMNRLLDQHNWSAVLEPQLPSQHSSTSDSTIGLEICSGRPLGHE
jgi:hypothetical protein